MARILLHLGLPKTATTTLQQEFFVLLHRMGKINYIGKRGDNAFKFKKTKNKQENNFHKIYSDIFSPLRRVENFEAKYPTYKKKIQSIIDEKKINVISDENLFFSFQSAKHHSQVFDEKLIEKIQRLLNPHKIEVLLVLRRQESFLYSWYTHHFSHIWFYTKNNENIHRYYKNLNQILSQEKIGVLFNYKDILLQLQKKFTKIYGLFFEELQETPESYYKKIFKILKIEFSSKNFPTKKLNIKNKQKDGVYIPSIKHPSGDFFDKPLIRNKNFFLYFFFFYLAKVLSRIFIRYNFLLSQKKKKIIFDKLIKMPVFFLNYFFYSQKIHPFFNKKQKESLMNLCKENNQKLAEKNFFSIKELKKYGYL